MPKDAAASGRRTRASDTRGVSTVLGYVLLLTVATLLVSGLLVGAGSLVDGQRDRTIRQELSVVGQQVAGDVETVDGLVVAASGSPSDLARTNTYSRAATGVGYTIALQTSPPRVVLSTSNPDIIVTVGVSTRTALEASSTPGGRVQVVYDAGGDDIELEGAS